MKNFTLLSGALLAGTMATAQINFDASIETNYIVDEVIMPASPLTMQPLFIGGHDMVRTTAHYGNASTETVAKTWNDFIGFTPDESGEHYGWISVNHERVVADSLLGDGGGMTVFLVDKNETTGELEVVEQTLSTHGTGKFFNVDFANTTGETGMNCGGITSVVDGRIWTAEEWWRSDNGSIADRDTSDFTIGTGTANGQAATAGFPGFNGETIAKYQNYNYMTEINPRTAMAVRKQYNWGRQPFEGGVVLPDNKTVIAGADATPGFLTKFVADVAGDFTVGTTYVYKEDAASKWVEIDNSDLDVMLNFADEAVALEATMFNRIEWVAYDPISEDVFFTETGRDNPGSRWVDESEEGAVHSAHTLARATAQGTNPDSSDYWDYYGRIVRLDMETNEVSVHLEGGPYYEDSPTISSYPAIHLSNPDGLNVLKVGDKSYLTICEDLNGTSHGRVPAGVSNRHCELFLLDISISNPSYDDLVRISVAPVGAEITGACPTPDGKSILINSQHPYSGNPFPYNHGLTYAIHGFNPETIGLIVEQHEEGKNFDFYPNPAARTVNFTEAGDFAIYSSTGARLKVYRAVNQIDISLLASGVYFIQDAEGTTKKLVVE